MDKTEFVYQLINYGKHYFLSRPRRFGKSLLLSTIKYLFQGEKDLFEGLWIENRHDWVEHPVIHLSFSSIGYKDVGLEKALHFELAKQASRYQIKLPQEGLGRKFRFLLETLSRKKGRVVLLIDEYDKPLVDYIDQLEQAETNRSILKSFFSVLKDADAYLRLFLITGVSKFSKVSLFSDLNNLEDLTLASYTSTLTGYTQQELNTHFAEEIRELAELEGLSLEKTKEKIRLWYNGYSWGGEKVYNPFSMLSFLKQKKFRNFWWETGTPTFLIKLLRNEFSFDLEEIELGTELFESYTLENMDARSLMFQTGYLTITHEDEELGLYILDYPNKEVRDAMHRHLLGAYRHKSRLDSQALFVKIKRSLEAIDLSAFVSVVNSLFSEIPHQLFIAKREAFFHALLHLALRGAGMFVQSEVSIAGGRLDTILQTTDHIFIMEFKLDGQVKDALQQIRDNRYGSPYLESGKEVIAVGINFDSDQRQVADWQAISYPELLAEF